MPRPVVSKLASVGSECEPKIASLERNKRDVAPRTQRHVHTDRHDYGFHGRGLKQGAKLVRRVDPCANLRAADIANRCGRGCGGSPSLDGPPPARTASRRPRRKSKQIWSCDGQYNATPALNLR